MLCSPNWDLKALCQTLSCVKNWNPAVTLSRIWAVSSVPKKWAPDWSPPDLRVNMASLTAGYQHMSYHIMPLCPQLPAGYLAIQANVITCYYQHACGVESPVYLQPVFLCMFAAHWGISLFSMHIDPRHPSK